MSRHLKVQEPDGTVRTIPLTGSQLTLGRSRDNDLPFPGDPSLSRFHVALVRDGDDWLIEDRGSKNGTLLDGRRVEGRVRLEPGAVVEAGQIRLVFEPEVATQEPVAFYPEADAAIPQGTVMTDLRGLLSGSRTAPRRGPSAPVVGPFQHPAFQAVIQATNELSGHRPLPELFRLILDLSIQAVGAERGVLMTLEAGRLATQAVHGDGFRISGAVRDRVLNGRTSLLVTDVGSDKDWAGQQSIVAEQVKTMMAVPLQTAERATGMIYLDSRNLLRPFSVDDLDLLTILANVAANRIEQERLRIVEETEQRIQRDMEQAAEIQQLFLPLRVPERTDVDVAGFNAACRTVGGDYYDFIGLPGGVLAVMLGDVSGKGLPAALLMTGLQATVHARAADSNDLAGLMSLLDRFVASRAPSNRFVSLFYAVYDPSSALLRYCNAGHNPPYVMRKDGSIERLPGSGTVLGILPELGYEERSVRLDSGDVLVMYSDGVTEATDAADQEFGEERLAELLAAHRTLPAVEIIEVVSRAVEAFTCGAPPADDLTLVVLRRL